MNLMHFFTLLFCISLNTIAARPQTDLDTFISTPVNIADISFDNDYQFTNYQVAPKYSLLSRLRRGYYYIDDGEITPVDSVDSKRNVKIRRQDSFPFEKYQTSKTKKLFVPNLFG